MSTVAFAGLARQDLREALDGVEAGIMQGAATWDEYQYMLGRRRGLQQALAVIDETIKRFDEQN